MAAGQGFKTFTTGEVLTAGDVNGYLMQGINVFTNATARDAAITAPAEGQFAFTKDNNSLWYYDGAAWVASGATGDIEGVTAGVGISGGGTSGTVTVTNSMATAITTNGDLIYGTGSGTFTRRGIGSTGDVLTVSGGVPTWAAASGGSFTTGVNTISSQQATTSTSYTDLSTVGAQVTVTTGTKALVTITSQIAKTGSATPNGWASFAISGATTLAASNTYGIQFAMTDAVGGEFQASGAWIVTGLTAGSNVFTMKYKDQNAGTSYFSNRTISVLNLGS